MKTQYPSLWNPRQTILLQAQRTFGENKNFSFHGSLEFVFIFSGIVQTAVPVPENEQTEAH